MLHLISQMDIVAMGVWWADCDEVHVLTLHVSSTQIVNIGKLCSRVFH